jgi:hypothetical protein
MTGLDTNTVGDTELQIYQLPKTALQALYHAVTGKTETYSRDLKKNVIIRYSDIEKLYNQIMQQIEHYKLVASPTITIVVKQDNNKSLQYSSWERFKLFQIHDNSITSEIHIKFEFLIDLPNTNAPQRCVVNVGLDSRLPVICNKNLHDDNAPLQFLIFLSREVPTVEISIEFIDFLVAKAFSYVIEEWFSCLEEIKEPKYTNFLINYIPMINAALKYFSMLGVATFLSSYVYFNNGQIGDIGKLVHSISVAILVWSLISISVIFLRRKISRRLSKNIIPSLILITDGDTKAYETVKSGMNYPYNTCISIIVTAILSIAINILSSYIYTYLTLGS